MLYDCDLEEQAHLFQAKHTFFNLSFEINEAILPREAELQLQELGSALLEVSDKLIIHIHGHSDNRPFQYDNPDKSVERNVELSHQRALAVAQALEDQGIAMTRFQFHPHGNQKLLTRENSPYALAKNRRIEIEVKPKEKKKY
jgi:flagellar motor protein MotB